MSVCVFRWRSATPRPTDVRPARATGGDIVKVRQVAPFLLPGSYQTTGRLLPLEPESLHRNREGFLCPFRSAGVVFAAPLSVVWCKLAQRQRRPLEFTQSSGPFPLSGVCVRLRFRHVERIQVVSDCRDRSDKPQKSD